jgi:hypothetical protein
MAHRKTFFVQKGITGVKKRSLIQRILSWALGIILGFFVLAVGTIALLSLKPSFGANGADFLRKHFGDKVVATLESNLYKAEDDVKLLTLQLGLTKNQAPAAIGMIATPIPPVAPVSSGSTTAPGSTAQPTPDSNSWNPPVLVPVSAIQNETGWASYLQNSKGQNIADLTSFQPDPKRPYAVAAVVAFDLTHTRLHFVLGTIEPYSPNSAPRSGAIPASDRVPGVLLAMFNGGFKAHQGMFGAMSGGVVALPPRDGLGTLAIDQNGGVQIGEWGKDINPSPNWVAWRQNGPLIIQNSEVTAKVSNPLPTDWGDTVGGTVPVWRSGIGLSADGNTLYYICGPSLTVQALANSFLAVGAKNAMQLDINNYWVHFVGVTTDGNKLILNPLFPKAMKENVDRYLWHYERDYFYVTSQP